MQETCMQECALEDTNCRESECVLYLNAIRGRRGHAGLIKKKGNAGDVSEMLIWNTRY